MSYDDHSDDKFHLRFGHYNRARYGKSWERFDEHREDEELDYMSDSEVRESSTEGETVSETVDEEFMPTENEQFEREDESLLVIVSLTLLLRLSRTQLQSTLHVIEFFSNKQVPFTVENVFAEIERRRKMQSPQTRFFCARCFCRVPRRKSCIDSNCENYGVPVKRLKLVDPIAITSFDIENQLRTVLNGSLDEIIRFHRSAHDFGVENVGREFRTSPRYFKIMESEEEFNNHMINVPISVFFDGFRLKKQTRKEYTPFYLRVESLERTKKTLPESVILFTIVESRSHVMTEAYELIGRNLLEQLERVSIILLSDTAGVRWTVRIKLSHGLSDLKGVHDACTLPYWFAEHGCHKCTLASVQRSRSARSFTGKAANRTAETMIQQFHEKTFNFGTEIGFNFVVLPCDFNLDILHILNEGVLKDWTKALLFSSSTWSERTTTPYMMKILTSTLSHLQNYTYSNSFVTGPKDFSRLTGCEIEAMSYVVMRVALLIHVYLDESVHVLLLGTVLICECLYRKDFKNMKKIANIIGDFHDISHKNYVTLKTHLMYRHLADDLMKNNKDAVDTADFERLHKYLQTGLVDQNCAHQSVEMTRSFLCLRDVRAALQKRTSQSRAITELLETGPGKFKRFPNAYEVTETLRASVRWEISLSSIQQQKPDWFRFMKKDSVIFYRALVRNQPFQSEKWISEPLERSQMHLISFKLRRNRRGSGSVCCFIVHDDASFVLVEEFTTSPALPLDSTKLPRHLQPMSQTIRQFADTSCDSLIVKCLKPAGLALIPTADVISPFLSLSLNDQTYFCPIRFSPIST